MYRDGAFEVPSFPERRVLGDPQYREILGPHRDKSFFDWWDGYHLGWLRYDVAAMRRDVREP